MGKVREAHLEQVGVPLHAGSLRPACGASRFRPATGASAYMRYPTTAWTVKARSAPVPDIVMNRGPNLRSEEHTSELQSQSNLVCRLLLEKKKKKRHQKAAAND